LRPSTMRRLLKLLRSRLRRRNPPKRLSTERSSELPDRRDLSSPSVREIDLMVRTAEEEEPEAVAAVTEVEEAALAVEEAAVAEEE